MREKLLTYRPSLALQNVFGTEHSLMAGQDVYYFWQLGPGLGRFDAGEVSVRRQTNVIQTLFKKELDLSQHRARQDTCPVGDRCAGVIAAAPFRGLVLRVAWLC